MSFHTSLLCSYFLSHKEALFVYIDSLYASTHALCVIHFRLITAKLTAFRVFFHKQHIFFLHAIAIDAMGCASAVSAIVT